MLPVAGTNAPSGSDAEELIKEIGNAYFMKLDEEMLTGIFATEVKLKTCLLYLERDNVTKLSSLRNKYRFRATIVLFETIDQEPGLIGSSRQGEELIVIVIKSPLLTVLCSYLIWGNGATLEDYLDTRVFNCCAGNTVMASNDEVKGFDKYIDNYRKLLDVEKKALEVFNA